MNLAKMAEAEPVHIMGLQDSWARLFRANNVEFSPNRTGVTVDTNLAAAEIVSAGGGTAVILERYARGLVAAGRVAIPVTSRIELAQAHYLVEPLGGRIATPEAERFKAWLVREFELGAG